MSHSGRPRCQSPLHPFHATAHHILRRPTTGEQLTPVTVSLVVCTAWLATCLALSAAG